MSAKYFPLIFPDASASSEVVVTSEEFNAFHSIDRTFFSRLVFILNLDRNQLMEVFSFLFMLEQSGYARRLISYLISLPDEFVISLFNEVVVCLNFLSNQAFATAFFVANTNDDHNSVIPLIVQLTGGKVSLRFIHHNREVFLEGIAKNINDICNRSFGDIWGRAEMYNREKRLALERERAIEEMQNLSLTTTAQQESTSRVSVHQETPVVRPSVRQESSFRPSFRQESSFRPNFRPIGRQETIYRPIVRQETIAPPPPPRPLVQEEAINTTPAENERKEDEDVVLLAPDDRTVFLTFSKGYPITEEEVKVYFTNRFGEVIETIMMQDVEAYEQPLFARMILKNSCAAKMGEIVSGRDRNKYTINGKHVWARKYVPKNVPSASSSSQI